MGLIKAALAVGAGVFVANKVSKSYHANRDMQGQQARGCPNCSHQQRGPPQQHDNQRDQMFDDQRGQYYDDNGNQQRGEYRWVPYSNQDASAQPNLPIEKQRRLDYAPSYQDRMPEDKMAAKRREEPLPTYDGSLYGASEKRDY